MKRSLSTALKHFFLFFASGLILFLGSPAFAGVLSMEVETTLGTEEDSLHGTIKVTNKGDEPALVLRAEILLPGEEPLQREITKRLEPKAIASLAFESRLPGLKKGTYPLPITVIFHDSKLYPFSALSCPLFSYGVEGRADLSGSAQPAAIGESGTISFDLRSSSSAARNIHATLLLPREFHCPGPGISFPLESQESKTLSFAIFNASALQGASYPVYGIFQYDTGEMHQALVVSTTLKISGKDNWFAKTRWYWLAGGLLLGVIVVGRRFKRG